MKFSRRLINSFILILLLLLPLSLFAVEKSVLEAKTEEALRAYVSAAPSERPLYLKTIIKNIIEERIILLSRLQLQVQESKRITTDAREDLTTEISSLSASLEKISKEAENETTIEALKNRLNEVYALKIYKTALPKLYGWLIVSRIDYDLAKINLILRNIETKVAKEEALKNNTLISSKIAEIKALLSDTKKETDSTLAEFQKLTPSAENSPSILETARQKLRDLRIKESRILTSLGVLAQLFSQANN